MSIVLFLLTMVFPFRGVLLISRSNSTPKESSELAWKYQRAGQLYSCSIKQMCRRQLIKVSTIFQYLKHYSSYLPSKLKSSLISVCKIDFTQDIKGYNKAKELGEASQKSSAIILRTRYRTLTGHFIEKQFISLQIVSIFEGDQRRVIKKYYFSCLLFLVIITSMILKK